MTTTALELVDIDKYYGALSVLSDVNLALEVGARHALVGPNGAGKSTLFSIIAGTDAATSGRVHVFGSDVTDTSEVVRARAGVAKTFQHSSLFDSCTVRENAFLAVARSERIGWRGLRPARKFTTAWRAVEAELELAGLEHVADLPVVRLSHGERRQLEVALALAGRPRLLLLDEPTAGMSPAETLAFVNHIQSLPPELTIVLVEHDLDVVFDLAQTVTVLSAGRVVAEGTADQVRQSEAAQHAYLGEQRDDQLFI